ncbi:hypothetical protein TNCV_3683491 [Trichonephila clavipes]|nr:hypothetical protein TNCV_3683491 [Trichonephila clavipes]
MISTLVEKWQLVNRKRFVFPRMQRQNLLLLCYERSGGHLSGHVNTHNARIWNLENPLEVLESHRDSPKLNVFCAISWRKGQGPFAFGGLSGHVNTHNARIWNLENPLEVLESHRDSPKLKGFCAISWRKGQGPIAFGEPTVTVYTYLLMLYNFGYFLN